MPALITELWESSPDGELSPVPGTSCPSLDEQPAQPRDGMMLDSDASRILIVDDNPEVLRLVARMAATLGYHPTIAEDGVDALFYLNKVHFDLVIADYDMPFIDGYQLADRIKEKHFGTRVIIMTGHCEKEVEDLLDGSGIVDGLLLKPFNLKTMKEKIEMAIQPHFAGWTSSLRNAGKND